MKTYPQLVLLKQVFVWVWVPPPPPKCFGAMGSLPVATDSVQPAYCCRAFYEILKVA